MIVVATVCDQSATNMSAINSLLNETNEVHKRAGVENKSSGFEVNGHKIYPIFDPPHILKGIRNNLLNKDLKFSQNGEIKIAKWQHLKILLEIYNGEDGILLVNKHI